MRIPLVPRVIIIALLWISIFAGYLIQITDNAYPFHTDEMYWISTADTWYRLIDGDITSEKWREYYGFTNPNGAKFLFGIGFWLTGITDVDGAGIPPDTYSRWMSITGAFPRENPMYHTLLTGRIISSLATSLAAAVLLAGLLSIYPTVLGGLLAAIAVGTHPLVHEVAIRVRYDGFFLLVEAFLFLAVYLVTRSRRAHSPIWNALLPGMLTGVAAGTKINGMMFLPIALMPMVLSLIRSRRSLPATLLTLTVGILLFGGGMCGMFLIINPNILFYPSYTLAEMIRERMAITGHHMEYFSYLPGHILRTPMARLSAFVTYVMTPAATVLTGLAALRIGLAIYKRRFNDLPLIALISLVAIITTSLSYIVFNEPRYFLPVLIPLGYIWGYGMAGLLTAVIRLLKRIRIAVLERLGDVLT